MPTARFLIIILLFLVVMWAETFILLQVDHPDQSETTARGQRQFVNPLTVRGLNIQIFQGDTVIRIKADNFEISPRKFYIFNVKQLNEIALNNVTIEFDIHPDKPAAKNLANIRRVFAAPVNGALSSPATLIAGAIKTGLITRGVYNNVVLKIYRNHRVVLIINAEKACAEFKKNKINFHKVVVEDLKAKAIVRSRLLILNNQADHFYIPNQYVKLSPLGVTSGKGLQIELRDS